VPDSTKAVLHLQLQSLQIKSLIMEAVVAGEPVVPALVEANDHLHERKLVWGFL
jgi:hypothetical protein